MNPFEKLYDLEKKIAGREKIDVPEEGFGYLGMPEGGRGLDEYERKMMLNRDDLRGKTILDLGAGPEAKFAEELKKAGIDASVFSLSPFYSRSESAEIVNKNRDSTHIVAGKVSTTPQEKSGLPFKDNSFDVVLVFHVDEHVDREISVDIVKEVGRTLKPGGYAKYGPLYNIPHEWNMYEFIGKRREDVLEYLNRYNVSISIEDVPEDLIRKQKVKDGYGNAFYVPAYYLVLRKKREEGTVTSN